MRVQDHIGVISWSLFDKALYILFGFVQIIIMHYTTLEEYGLYSLLIFLHSWIFTISDSFALQNLIQFGMNSKNTKKVNAISLILHILITFGTSIIIFTFKGSFSQFFHEPLLEKIAFFLPLLSLAFIPKSFSQKIIYRIQNMFYLFLTNLAFFGIITVFILYHIFHSNILTFNDLSTYYIFGSIASSVTALILTKKHLIFSFSGEIKFKALLSFSWKMTSINLLNSLPKQIDAFIVKFFFPLEIVGLYSAAKYLFRLFDEAVNALYGLLYPSAVKHWQQGNKGVLNTLLSKSVSFVFWGFVLISLIIISPLGSYLFKLIIPHNYEQSTYYLKLLLISTPFLSFIAFYSVLTAANNLKNVFFPVLISNVGFLVISLLIGNYQLKYLVPFGLITYNVLLGSIGLYLGFQNFDFNFKMLFRAFNDSYNFLQNRINKR